VKRCGHQAFWMWRLHASDDVVQYAFVAIQPPLARPTIPAMTMPNRRRASRHSEVGRSGLPAKEPRMRGKLARMSMVDQTNGRDAGSLSRGSGNCQLHLERARPGEIADRLSIPRYRTE